jgi:hypothetical protein
VRDGSNTIHDAVDAYSTFERDTPSPEFCAACGEEASGLHLVPQVARLDLANRRAVKTGGRLDAAALAVPSSPTCGSDQPSDFIALGRCALRIVSAEAFGCRLQRGRVFDVMIV